MSISTSKIVDNELLVLGKFEYELSECNTSESTNKMIDNEMLMLGSGIEFRRPAFCPPKVKRFFKLEVGDRYHKSNGNVWWFL